MKPFHFYLFIIFLHVNITDLCSLHPPLLTPFVEQLPLELEVIDDSLRRVGVDSGGSESVAWLRA